MGHLSAKKPNTFSCLAGYIDRLIEQPRYPYPLVPVSPELGWSPRELRDANRRLNQAYWRLYKRLEEMVAGAEVAARRPVAQDKAREARSELEGLHRRVLRNDRAVSSIPASRRRTPEFKIAVRRSEDSARGVATWIERRMSRAVRLMIRNPAAFAPRVSDPLRRTIVAQYFGNGAIGLALLIGASLAMAAISDRSTEG